ncbi:hypothetical protein Palpr_2121 [Paludibacter propionicigenes WB4]|uniref:Outer membrane protein beta-barrel domain-containing protein n=1 Tax=Paludibacter propionicigenes (strain DSM 17365 / JCM 13257 / WB4) TaxID=694427 RepID=E4T6B3_PALPW|nr:outer membrane beta-barrel protein [Paludibacter propionicigenes]ADQ80257.1 hypothetical protein Palpr_2121 [Paludibacter propionicigenes WB4]
MKKICSLIIILSAFHFAASAQYTQGKIYIDGSVNYNNDNMSIATLKVGEATKTTSNNLTISPNIGYFVSDNFAIGIGLEYISLSSSNTALTGIEFDYIKKNLVNKIIDESSSKWKELAPTLFAKYIIPVSDKLSFSLKAKFSHGLLTDDIAINSTTINYDDKGSVSSQTSSTVVSEKPSKQTNRFSISPEFQYLITNKIGLQINFTGFSYNSIPVINPSFEQKDDGNFYHVVNYGTQKTTSFTINPSSWSFGVFFLLGKGSESKEIKTGE